MCFSVFKHSVCHRSDISLLTENAEEESALMTFTSFRETLAEYIDSGGEGAVAKDETGRSKQSASAKLPAMHGVNVEKKVANGLHAATTKIQLAGRGHFQ